MTAWLAQHSGQLAMALDLVLLVFVVLGVRWSPRAKRALCEAVAEQVGAEVAKQIGPIREDVAALRRDLMEVEDGMEGLGGVIGDVLIDVATGRIELVINDDEPAKAHGSN